ncbi:MAG: AAA family ATPase [Thermoplasmata archaeon]|nr:AAA family ATPase [Thermoplasmata archaeon]
MAFPIDIQSLIEGRLIEGARLEFKKNWNPERTLHSICAFANDIDDWGGGYIVLGIDDENGNQISGIDPSSVDRIQKELINISNLIKPRYYPISDNVRYKDKVLLVIWVPAGMERPYSCPIRLNKDGNTKERAYYIRKASSTVQSGPTEERELFSRASTTPFDDQGNDHAALDDIKTELVSSFLYDIGSSMFNQLDAMDHITALRQMDLVRGLPEDPHPANVGLLFFNRDPEKFFRCARIEVAEIPDPAGDSLSERTFTGPLPAQIRDCLTYVKNYLISEKIYKVQDKAEAIRFYNYPFQALEEGLINAVFHKDYRIPEPVTMVSYRDRIEITSCPGPDRSISDSDISSMTMISRHQTNRRIGDYLKELHLSEGRNTGIPKIKRAMEMNGNPPARILTDEARSYCTLILPIHPDFLKETEKDSYNEEDRIESLIRAKGCLAMKDICTNLGYSGVNKRVSDVIKRMISEGRLEYLYPDKPRNPKQRICLKR